MVKVRGAKAAKGIATQVAGWALVLVGLAALVLPGPGLLALLAGMVLLATQYEWADRRLDSVRDKALQTAADGVATTGRIVLSVLGVVWLIGLGVVWGIRPPAPDWWPLAERWWLPGGWGTGGSLIFSGLVAGGLIVYSYRNFREIEQDKHEEEAR